MLLEDLVQAAEDRDWSLNPERGICGSAPTGDNDWVLNAGNLCHKMRR